MHPFLQLLLIAIFFSSWLILHTRRRRNEAPGPPRLPIIGNLHQFGSTCPHLHLHKLSNAYGPLMSLKLGSVRLLVVSSAEMARHVFKTHDRIFSNRPRLTTLQKLSYNFSDISFAPYGDHWRQFKKISLIHLFSQKKVCSFSSIREDEIRHITEEIRSLSNEGGVVDLSAMMVRLTSTVICKIAFGRRFESAKYEGSGRSFQDMLSDVGEMFMTFCCSDYFPTVGWIYDQLAGTTKRLHNIFMEFDGFYQRVIDEHVNSDGPQAGQEDIVDVLLELQRQTSLGFAITNNNIKAILMNIFIAGTDTSAATIVWAMTELMRHPDAMKRVRKETRDLMKNKIGDGIMKEEDVEKLVYLKAVVKETMRMHPVVPLLLPHETTQKCTIQEWEVQEKTMVYFNVWAIGRDPDAWEKPHEFMPERFLEIDKEIDFRGQDFELIPFGSGRRICPGIQMGLVMVEVALANLICLFDWKVSEGMEKNVLDTNASHGVVSHKRYPLCLVAKNSSV